MALSGFEDDLLIVQRVLAGDPSSYSALVSRYSPALLSFCRSRLGDDDDARDALQDVFLRAYRSLASFRLGHSFRSWLFAIADNRVKTRYAARMAEKVLRDRAAAEYAVRAPGGQGGDTEEEALAVLEGDSARKALAALGKVNRRVAELYYLGGLSVDEVAQSLGIGLEAVKSRLFRARKEIYRILTSATGDGMKGY